MRALRRHLGRSFQEAVSQKAEPAAEGGGQPRALFLKHFRFAAEGLLGRSGDESPRAIKEALDRGVIGQERAKKVAR